MINDEFWRAWRWLAWALPVALIAMRVFLGGGWEVFILVLYSPIIIAIAGFLGWLPRFILRKRGFTTAPASAVVFITAYWSGLFWYLLALPAVGDSGSEPSMMRNMLPFMSERYEGYAQQMALMVSVSAFVGALITAGVATPPTAASATNTGGVKRGAGWGLVGALFLTPVVIVGAAGLIEVVSLHGPEDAAGNQQADVMSLDADAVRELHQSRWDELQAQLVDLRGSIAEDGWDASGSSGPDDYAYRERPDMYHVAIEWSLIVDADDPAASMTWLADRATEAGWTLAEDPLPEGFSATSSTGAKFQAYRFPATDTANGTKIVIRAQSADYWMEKTAVTWASLDTDGPRYRYDEWPALVPED